jgi:HlyD family secretion protein
MGRNQENDRTTLPSRLMAIKDLIYKHRKLVTYGGITLLAVVFGGLALRGRSSGPQYLTAEVRRGSITAVVQATGTINPLTTVPVGSYVSGTVKYIFADYNSHVQAGQVLAQLDPSIYDAQAITARGNLANARASLLNLQASVDVAKANIQADQANVTKAQANLDYARSNGRRNADLFKQGIVSSDQNDLTQSTLAQAEASLRSAEAQVKQAEAQLEQTAAQVKQAQAQIQSMTGQLRQAETNLSYTTIVSPIDGTVVSRNITVGQSVAATLQAPNVFTIAQDLKRMEVDAQIDESDTGNIKIGTGVTFQVDAFPDEVFQGRVTTIRLNATVVQNVVTYDTVIDFDNPLEKLLPNETAYVTIPTGHAKDALEVPNAALTFTPNLPAATLRQVYRENQIPAAATSTHLAGWQVVWKEVPGGKLKPIALRGGITDNLFTQCLEGDLHVGDALVTAVRSGGAGGGPGRGPVGGFRRGL